MHRSYAKNAQVTLPSLERYEQNTAADQIIPLWSQQGRVVTGPVSASN